MNQQFVQLKQEERIVIDPRQPSEECVKNYKRLASLIPKKHENKKDKDGIDKILEAMLGVSSNDTVSMVAMINFYKPALDELRNRLKDRRFALDELLRLLDMLFAEKYEPSMKDLLITTKKEIAVLAASANQAIFIEMVRAFYHRISVSENLDLFEEAINKRKDVSEILNKLNPENSDMDIFIKRARWRNKFDLEFPPS